MTSPFTPFSILDPALAGKQIEGTLVFRLIHLHPAARLASAFLARLRLRVIDRGVAVQTKGFGLAFR